MLRSIPMPAPTRLHKHAFVLIPIASKVGQAHDIVREPIRAAVGVCRVAYRDGMQPICPILHYTSYLSPAEYLMEAKRLSQTWLRRCDRIWIHFPGEDERLDALSFDVLDENEHRPPTTRRPVYRIRETPDDVVAAPVPREDIKDLLLNNLSAAVANQCI